MKQKTFKSKTHSFKIKCLKNTIDIEYVDSFGDGVIEIPNDLWHHIASWILANFNDPNPKVKPFIEEKS